MRIIGGDLRGRAIVPPSNFSARPTTDFAKEGLFNVLINDIDFSEVSALDLFSGTGGITYEMASRGCEDIVAVEMNAQHARFIKLMVGSFKLEGVQVVRHNVFDFLPICKKDFDFIFADPPYEIAGLETIPEKVLSTNILKEGGLFVLEHSGSFNFADNPRFIKEKKYGNVHFSFFK